MYDNLLNQQPIADAVKVALWPDGIHDRDEVRIIQMFEAASWRPDIFAVLKRSLPGHWYVKAPTVRYTPQQGKDRAEARSDILVLFEQYVALVDAVHPTPERWLTRDQAAEYLGISVRGLERHYLRNDPPTLPPDHYHGRTPMWAQSTLDAFMADERNRKPGPKPSE